MWIGGFRYVGVYGKGREHNKATHKAGPAMFESVRRDTIKIIDKKIKEFIRNPTHFGGICIEKKPKKSFYSLYKCFTTLFTTLSLSLSTLVKICYALS